jgi:Cadherin domain.
LVFLPSYSLGLITISKEMDRETRDNYIITLVAKDNGQLRQRSATIKLTITVTDINDNAPVVETTTGRVLENSPAKTQVTIIRASDKDIGKNKELVYTLESHRDLFALNENTGELVTRRPLDREEQSRYTLSIVVYDKGNPRLKGSADILVIIKDLDDNCPVFERDNYYARLEENSAFGTFVVTVKATDRDEGTNADLSYGILGGNDRGKFLISLI